MDSLDWGVLSLTVYKCRNLAKFVVQGFLCVKNLDKLVGFKNYMFETKGLNKMILSIAHFVPV